MRRSSARARREKAGSLRRDPARGSHPALRPYCRVESRQRSRRRSLPAPMRTDECVVTAGGTPARRTRTSSVALREELHPCGAGVKVMIIARTARPLPSCNSSGMRTKAEWMLRDRRERIVRATSTFERSISITTRPNRRIIDSGLRARTRPDRRLAVATGQKIASAAPITTVSKSNDCMSESTSGEHARSRHPDGLERAVLVARISANASRCNVASRAYRRSDRGRSVRQNRAIDPMLLAGRAVIGRIRGSNGRSDRRSAVRDGPALVDRRPHARR
jgi:hypothetical protein